MHSAFAIHDDRAERGRLADGGHRGARPRPADGNLSGNWESHREMLLPMNWRFASGDRLEVNVVPTGERLSGSFAVADHVVIPTGAYHWRRYRLEAGTAAKRKISGRLTSWFGSGSV
jgi:hypothetical protein